MAELFKNTELSKEELIQAYEEIAALYKKESSENFQLKKTIEYLKEENWKLQRRVNELRSRPWK